MALSSTLRFLCYLLFKSVGQRNRPPIDTSGQFHNDPSFANYEELRNLFAQREPDFARGFTEHLIEYALGRPYGFTDQTIVPMPSNSSQSSDANDSLSVGLSS